MRSDLPPPLRIEEVDATHQPGTDPTLRHEVARGLQIVGFDLAVASSHPVHEYVELRRFRRELRRRAHLHAGLRLASACLLAAAFVLTFLKDTTETQSKTGFAPRPVAAR